MTTAAPAMASGGGGVTLRPARAGDNPHCQAIAVAAWTPIYAYRRRQLGDAVFDRLHPAWEQRKAAEIAG
ncbi:MAG: hypothetical protein M3442_16190, partial [Chloroflexota bacterium]|nr:hypothetical protein [Chloroflexota bacterium]